MAHFTPLQGLDWIIIGAYCALIVGIGIYFSRRAKNSTDDYFVAGRKLTWWLAGTSIVATSFSADTPLVLSGWMRTFGLSRNWFWWSGVMGMMLCTFFYARLWRRANIITDVEFVELRYQGKPAAVLRGFHATYRALIQNTLIMSWVMLAGSKIMSVVLNIPSIALSRTGSFKLIPDGADLASVMDPATVLCVMDDRIIGTTVAVVITLIYVVMSGLWGVVVNDFILFGIAMTGSILLAVYTVHQAGGVVNMVGLASEVIRSGQLENGTTRMLVSSPEKMLSFIPPFDFTHGGYLAIWSFVVFIGLQWWGGGEGGGFLAQRLFSCKNEKHSVLAMLWFNFANYVLRPWPWILVGIGSIAFVPNISAIDPSYNVEHAYIIMLMKYLPAGLKGMMFASLAAAFMSTMDTHLNFGSSYIINDLYRRFMVRNASPKHYVRASQLVTVLLALLAGVFSLFYTSISGSWLRLFELTAGTGFCTLLRWYWWRINAWSEISALASSILFAVVLDKIPAFGATPEIYEEMYPVRFALNVFLSTVVWVVVTFLTKPVDEKHLARYYRRVRPAGAWAGIPAMAGVQNHLRIGWREVMCWFLGVACIFTSLFGLGKLLFGQTGTGIALLVSAVACAGTMFHLLARMDWSVINESGESP